MFIARQLLEGLDALHANNIIYKDLKASHVFITGQGSVTLIDYGMAEQLSDSKQTLQAGGTLHSMSPEMLKLYVRQKSGASDEQQQQVDCKSDVYGVGVLLLEFISPRDIHYSQILPVDKLAKYEKLRQISTYQLPPHSQFSTQFKAFIS